MRDVRKAKRQLYVWTVDGDNLMKWSIQHQVDGVITDDPKKFKRICDEWDEREPPARPSWIQWLYIFWVWTLIGVFSMPFRRKFPETVEQFIRSTDLRTKATLTMGKVGRVDLPPGCSQLCRSSCSLIHAGLVGSQRGARLDEHGLHVVYPGRTTYLNLLFSRFQRHGDDAGCCRYR
jgi:phosphatidylglycerol phospholipase C